MVGLFFVILERIDKLAPGVCHTKSQMYVLMVPIKGIIYLIAIRLDDTSKVSKHFPGAGSIPALSVVKKYQAIYRRMVKPHETLMDTDNHPFYWEAY
jgi:hypothetical protein